MERRICVRGLQLEASHIPPQVSGAPTVVFLHEGLGSTALWKDIPATLAAETGCGVFVFSRSGYGHSAPIQRPRALDYLSEEAFDVLPAVIEQIPTSTIILIGHSDGASIGALYASRYPEGLLGLILIAPHFFVESLSLNGIRDAREHYEKGDLRRRLDPYHDDVDGAFYGWNDAWLHPDFVRWNIEDCLEQIDTSVLVVQGLSDPYGSVRQVEIAQHRLPNTPETLLLEGCGHAPHIEARPTVMNRIVQFCRRVSP